VSFKVGKVNSRYGKDFRMTKENRELRCYHGAVYTHEKHTGAQWHRIQGVTDSTQVTENPALGGKKSNIASQTKQTLAAVKK
jgi:hypothetical protein